MAQKRKVSVIIPVYWNEQSLPPLFAELTLLEGELGRKGYDLELIFVDDGSGDCSFVELIKIKKQRPQTKILKLTRNFGAIHASKAGFQFVTGDCFLILAADLQDPPELILRMVERWEAGCKFVLCVRKGRHDPLLSKIMSAVYYRLLRWFVVPDYPDGGFDLSLMDRALLPYLKESGKNINTPLFAYWLGFDHETIEYQRRPRHYGRSRWSFGKKVKFFLDSLLGFSILPIRMISFLGIVISLLSFGYGSWILVHALLGQTDVRGFATIVALISFLFGVVIVMLGIIGEYLWRIFDETNKRPEVVFDQVLQEDGVAEIEDL